MLRDGYCLEGRVVVGRSVATDMAQSEPADGEAARDEAGGAVSISHSPIPLCLTQVIYALWHNTDGVFSLTETKQRRRYKHF